MQSCPFCDFVGVDADECPCLCHEDFDGDALPSGLIIVTFKIALPRGSDQPFNPNWN